MYVSVILTFECVYHMQQFEGVRGQFLGAQLSSFVFLLYPQGGVDLCFFNECLSAYLLEH